jgi:cold shock protein
MGKGRDRGPRRRGFDDDMYSPPEPPRGMGSGQPYRPPQRVSMDTGGPTVDAKVKWFNGEKGFGFVELADGSGDAFLHIGAVQAAGHDTVTPETKLKVQVGQGQKGRQVTAVIEVGALAEPGAGGSALRGPRLGGAGAPPGRRSFDRERVDPSTAVELDGAVKWFKGDKGFGFVGADDGGKDVFIHISVLERAGINALAEGQRVAMRVVTTQKGREAISIDLAD